MLDPVTKLLAAIGVFGALAILGTSAPLAAGVPGVDEPQSPAEYEVITGEISHVDTEMMVFALDIGETSPLSIKLTNETRYLHNGEIAEQAAVLVEGIQVAVRHSDGEALVVSHRAQQRFE